MGGGYAPPTSMKNAPPPPMTNGSSPPYMGQGGPQGDQGAFNGPMNGKIRTVTKMW